MNAYSERFNRTFEVVLIDFHQDLRFEDLNAFNDKCLDDLIGLNESRPHARCHEFTVSMQIHLGDHQCNMDWKNTEV